MLPLRELRFPDDQPSVVQLWRSIGWLDDVEDDDEALGWMFDDARAVGVDLHGQIAGAATRHQGDLRYEDAELPLSLVSSVAVARHARTEGLGSRLTAAVVRDAAVGGAAVSILGVYDLGYYDRLGFGTAANLRMITVDPVDLLVPKLTRSPVPLTIERDAARMQRNRLRRMRGHGSASYQSLGLAVGEAAWAEHSYGMGFEGPDGELTHHMFLEREGEHGPDQVLWMAYETHQQAIELLSVMKSWSTQVHGVRLIEPAGLQLSELLRQPFRRYRTSKGGDFEQRPEGQSWTQLRILDLPACMAAVALAGPTVRFQLELSDPIEAFLAVDSAWTGLTGTWTIELGERSRATRGGSDGLLVMAASVNAFTRLWFGAATATTLRGMGKLDAPDELVEQLDRRWRLARPVVDWDA